MKWWILRNQDSTKFLCQFSGYGNDRVCGLDEFSDDRTEEYWRQPHNDGAKVFLNYQEAKAEAKRLGLKVQVCC